MNVKYLEQQADILAQNIAGWESSTVNRIAKRIGKTGKMSIADVQALNNAAIVKGDMQEIYKELAKATGQNILQVKEAYTEALKQQHLENKPLYDFRGIDFIPFEDNTRLQAIVSAFSKTTAENMVNLSKSSVLGLVESVNGKEVFKPLEKFYKKALDKAVMQVTSGTTDFYTAMRDTIRDLGGSGMRVNYDSGITRRLDTAVRQSMLWGAKQAYNEYENIIGEELGCDGIEIDWHSNPRPSHEFMQGRQFAVGEEVTMNGETYPSADDESQGDGLSVNQALDDYGCLHFATPIILGISEPAHSKEELKRLNEENSREFTIGNKTQNGYGWEQDMRKLETEIRKQKGIKEAAQAEGDKELVKKCNARIKACKDKYAEISEVTGIKEQPKRMSVTKHLTN